MRIGIISPLLLACLLFGLVAPASAALSADRRLDLTFPVAGIGENADVHYVDDYARSRDGGRLHKSTDIMAPAGTPIHAAVGGTVRDLTFKDQRYGWWGYSITITGDDGLRHGYLHMGTDEGPSSDAYAPGLAKGARVERGQLIGYVGCSGSASCGGGEHLHYDIEDPAYAPNDNDYENFRYNPYPSLNAAVDRGDVPGAVDPVEVAGAGVPGAFHSMKPTRVLDTRIGLGAERGRTSGGESITVPLAGEGSIPSDAVAVAVNVTVTEPSRNGYVTVFPTGESRPGTSTVNYTTGVTVPNMAIVKLGDGGSLDVYTFAGRAHVLFDVAGYYTAVGDGGAGFVPVDPERILDTRIGLNGPRSPIGHRTQRDIQVAGKGSVPSSGVESVVLNVTATDATATSSYLTVFPAGGSRPTTSSLNFTGGQNVPNVVVAALGEDGKVTVYNHSGWTDVIFDVAGYHTNDASSVFVPVTPTRVLDTRVGTGARRGAVGKTGLIDLSGLPDRSATAVILNVTVTKPTKSSYLTVHPAGTTRPTASNVNWEGGDTVANLVVVRIGDGQRLSLANYAGAAHVVADVLGYITSG